MRRTLCLVIAVLLPLPTLAAEASQLEAEVIIDRIEWSKSGTCTIALTLKNPNAAPLTATGTVVLKQGGDATLGKVTAVFPTAAPHSISSIEVPVSLDALGGQPCAPPLTAAFCGDMLHLEGTDETIQQPLWLNVAADFDGSAH